MLVSVNEIFSVNICIEHPICISNVTNLYVNTDANRYMHQISLDFFTYTVNCIEIYLFLEVFCVTLYSTFKLDRILGFFFFLRLKLLCVAQIVTLELIQREFCLYVDSGFGHHIHPIHHWNFAPIFSLCRRNNVKMKN